MSRPVRHALAAVVVGVVALLPTACVRGDAPSTGDGQTIAFLLPESKTARYEMVDRPEFVSLVTKTCPDCHVIYANAGQDAARQQQQAESALSQGARVLVLDAVDAVAARGIVEAAASRGVQVVAYDRFISEVPLAYYVAYDAGRVGQMQGEALAAAVRPLIRDPRQGILLVHGAPTDPNAAIIKNGFTEAMWGSGVPVLAEYDSPDWSPDAAQQWVESQLTIYGDRVVGVYAANDGTASGAISALRAAGMDHPVPPVTGQDADLAAVQRVVSGDQLMTVYKRIGQEAHIAATVAVGLARGEDVPGGTLIDGVPSRLLTPVAVTRSSLRSVIVGGGVFSVEDICTPTYRQDCQELGLLEGDS